MSNRRMISKDIFMTDKFLGMAPSAQALYTHLQLHADDEGVVEATLVRKMCGFRKPALVELYKNEYIVPLDEDMKVAWICHWTDHNKIPPSHFHSSIYHTRLIELGLKDDTTVSESCNNEAYESSNNAGSETSSENKMSSKDRLGKDRLGKDSAGKRQSGAGSKMHKNAFNSFEQHPYDFDDLEQKIIKGNQERSHQEEKESQK